MGDEGEDNYQRLDIVLVPCNYMHTSFGWDKDSIHPECEPKLSDQAKYLGPSHWLMLVNQERINPEEFGPGSVERYSVIKN